MKGAERTRQGAAWGEFELIERLFKPLAAAAPGALGLTDDAALLTPEPDHELVVTKDGIVAGVHFLPDCPPDSLAAKLLGVNLSDLASMGAEPLAYLLMLARPPGLSVEWLRSFARGLATTQEAAGCSLIGGDTVSTTGPLVLSCTAIGQVPRGQAVTRAGASVGDALFVSGTLGDAALGLRVLKGLAADEEVAWRLVERYRRPQPRLALGKALRGVASAMVDVSDGLLADLGHVLEASSAARGTPLGATLRAEALPLSEVARHMPRALESALAGGDDYELLFAAPSSAKQAVTRAAAAAGTPVAEIGEVTATPGVTVLDASGRPVATPERGWAHF